MALSSEREERIWDLISVLSLFAVIIAFTWRAAVLAQDGPRAAQLAPAFREVAPPPIMPPCPSPLDVIR